MVMYVEYHNHVPQAQLIARDVDVRWGEDKGIATVIDELGRRGGKRVGVMGPLAGPRWKALEAKFQVVSLDGE
jgi:Xaa-Pro dipeptidase